VHAKACIGVEGLTLVPMTVNLSEDDLRALALEAERRQRCPSCAALWRAGWEAVSGAMRTDHLAMIGSLRRDDAADRLDEYHPDGTNLWSENAPIALGWHPYNLCSVWRCAACESIFLRYTEYGGYYEEERIRPVQSNLVAAPPSD